MAHGFKPKGPNFNIPNSLAVTGKKSILNNENFTRLPKLIQQVIQQSGGSYTFTNGLKDTSGTVKIGGDLVENTLISGKSYSFTVSQTSQASIGASSGNNSSKAEVNNNSSVLIESIAATKFSRIIMNRANNSGIGFVYDSDTYYFPKSVPGGNNMFLSGDNSNPSNLTWKPIYDTTSLVLFGYSENIVNQSPANGFLVIPADNSNEKRITKITIAGGNIFLTDTITIDVLINNVSVGNIGLSNFITYGEITCSEIVLVNPSIITFDISISGSSSTGLVATVTTNYT